MRARVTVCAACLAFCPDACRAEAVGAGSSSWLRRDQAAIKVLHHRDAAAKRREISRPTRETRLTRMARGRLASGSYASSNSLPKDLWSAR